MFLPEPRSPKNNRKNNRTQSPVVKLHVSTPAPGTPGPLGSPAPPAMRVAPWSAIASTDAADTSGEIRSSSMMADRGEFTLIAEALKEAGPGRGRVGVDV